MIFCGMMVTSGPERAGRLIISRTGVLGKVTFVSCEGEHKDTENVGRHTIPESVQDKEDRIAGSVIAPSAECMIAE